jgi:ABC-type transport system involved in cytochrome bd biosynthesis fused ATPase/permease subunit
MYRVEGAAIAALFALMSPSYASGLSARLDRAAIIVVTHNKKIVTPFKRIYHIRDGKIYEESGEGRPR